MRPRILIPIAVLALAVACNEKSTDPMSNSVPLFAGGSGSPHFLANATSCSRVGNNLVCTFKEAGLSAGSVEQIQLAVFASAGYSCVNGGGNIPSDPKKTESGTTTVQGSFTVAKNGNLIGSLTATPPPSTLNCPGGQVVTLITVSYGPTATIQDLTSGASIDVTGF
jgi:hypothetical protein